MSLVKNTYYIYNTYSNLYKIMRTAVNITMSSAACEFSFSSIRRIKNWSRNRTAQERFSYLSTLSIV